MNRLKKHVLRMMVVLMAVFLLLGCSKPKSEEAVAGDQIAAAKPVEKKSDSNPYELISTEWVTSQASNSASQQTAYWNEDQPDGGLMLVLKYQGKGSVEYYSSDFSLGYEDEAGIPRSACLGISMGVMQTDQIKQSSWMLAGAMSRSWASQEKPFLGILFSVPRTVRNVTLYLARPAMKDIGVKPLGESK